MGKLTKLGKTNANDLWNEAPEINVFKSPNRLIEQWVDQTTNRD